MIRRPSDRRYDTLRSLFAERRHQARPLASEVTHFASGRAPGTRLFRLRRPPHRSAPRLRLSPRREHRIAAGFRTSCGISSVRAGPGRSASQTSPPGAAGNSSRSTAAGPDPEHRGRVTGSPRVELVRADRRRQEQLSPALSFKRISFIRDSATAAAPFLFRMHSTADRKGAEGRLRTASGDPKVIRLC
jgi:hypothetical protein